MLFTCSYGVLRTKTAEFVQTYERGGRLLLKHQIVAARIADMATRVAAVRSLVMQAAKAVDKEGRDQHDDARNV